MTESSAVAHSRKSRLHVPSGGDLMNPSTSSISAMPSSSLPTIVSQSPGGARTTMAMKHPQSTNTNATATLPSSSLYGHHTGNLNHHGSSSSFSPMQYFQRLLDISQMDIQSALDQMRTLVSTRPQAVYKTAYYRKQTKNHWARDDPAFVALQFVFLVLSSIAYSVAFRVSLSNAFSFFLSSVLFNWLGIGFVISFVCREIANRHLNSIKASSGGGGGGSTSSTLLQSSATSSSSSLHVRQQVEWLYAFDIHCNSFFPVFVVLCKLCCLYRSDVL